IVITTRSGLCSTTVICKMWPNPRMGGTAFVVCSCVLMSPPCTRLMMQTNLFSDKITFNAMPYIFDGAAHMHRVLVEPAQHDRSLQRGDHEAGPGLDIDAGANFPALGTFGDDAPDGGA